MWGEPAPRRINSGAPTPSMTPATSACSGLMLTATRGAAPETSGAQRQMHAASAAIAARKTTRRERFTMRNHIPPCRAA